MSYHTPICFMMSFVALNFKFISPCSSVRMMMMMKWIFSMQKNQIGLHIYIFIVTLVCIYIEQQQQHGGDEFYQKSVSAKQGLINLDITAIQRNQAEARKDNISFIYILSVCVCARKWIHQMGKQTQGYRKEQLFLAGHFKNYLYRDVCLRFAWRTPRQNCLTKDILYNSQ